MSLAKSVLGFCIRGLLPVLLVAVGAWLAYEIFNTPGRSGRRERPRVVAKVEVAELNKQNYRPLIDSRGAVRPSLRAILKAEIRGRVTHVSESFRSGNDFAKNEILFQLDATETKLEVERLALEKSSSEAELAALDVELRELGPQIDLVASQLTMQKSRFERAKRLVKKGVRNKEELESFQMAELGTAITLQNLKSRKALLVAGRGGAENAIEMVKFRLKAAKIELSKTVIRAPYAGRVLSQSVDLGDYVSPGTELARIFSTAQVEIRLPLSSLDLPFVDLPDHDSQSVSEASGLVTIVSSIGEKSYRWPATLLRTESSLDVQSRQLFIVVAVAKPFAVNKDGRPPLRLGRFVTAIIQGKEIPNAYLIPRSALRGERELFLVRGETLRRQKVEILHKGEDVIVARGGIDDKDKLCLTPIVFGGKEIAVKVLGSGAKKPGQGGSKKGQGGGKPKNAEQGQSKESNERGRKP
ncbi:MAG: HlyD family efflux transporter periplasmic adaptor subunit [Planctomycetota bacterium]|nr:HlyD family efflux transporter periplasmic adaptor subunit [Planctomycetota bacterium]